MKKVLGECSKCRVEVTKFIDCPNTPRTDGLNYKYTDDEDSKWAIFSCKNCHKPIHERWKELRSVVLFSRYDLKEVMNKQEARNLLALINKALSHECIRIAYIKGAVHTSRQQVKLYDVDKVIAHFEGKVGGEDARFIKSWKKYLKVLKKIKVLKLKELEKEKLLL